MFNKFVEALPRSLAASAVMAGSVACSYATAGTSNALLLVIKTFIDLSASLAANIAASDLYKVIADKINHKDVLTNGDLARAVADAILATITYTAGRLEHSHRRNEILLLTENTAALLQQLLHGEATHALGDAQDELRKLSASELTDIFTADPEVFARQKSTIPVEGWEELVMWLAKEKNAMLSNSTMRSVAEDLHELFPHSFLQVIKIDFAKDGQAYAALQHQISNRLLVGQKEIYAAVAGVSQQVANMEQKLERKLDEMRAQMPRETAKELENILQTYEAYTARREALEQSRKKLQVLELKDDLHGHIRDLLYSDPRNTFFRKYVPNAIYLPRKEAESKFLEFLAQSDERCFVAIGQAGMGKTCLLCRLAESLTLHSPRSLPLLMSAESIQLTSPHADELSRAIVERVGTIIPSMREGLTFEGFAEFLRENGLDIVVLIDGLNELQGSDSYANFNAQFERLVELVAARDLPVRFALTCRYEWWQYFSASRWTDKHIYGKDLAVQATLLLEPPSEKEVKQLSEKYFDHFAIKGELTGEALRTCQTLLMLRFLCDAYTNRPADDKTSVSAGIKPYELKEISSFKKKEILKQYVASRRDSFVEFVRSALSDSGATDTTASHIYFLTTLYIINIANFMYLKRAASVTAEEVFRTAKALGHPDALLGPDRIVRSSRSVFLRLIDLGIFSRSEKNSQEFSFVYETYFEFSLGRYIAFVRWRELTGGSLERSAIEKDLKNLIVEHGELSRNGEFSNLFGAVQFAVLATEAGDWIDWTKVPAEESVYRRRPQLFSQLVGRLAETTEGFDWLQQACTIIREAELAKPETWSQFGEQDGNRVKAREQFGELLNALDTLAKTTDFVLLWDIENALKTLAQANLVLTLAHLARWAESGDSLKTVFAAQVISALALDHPEDVLHRLLEWMQNEKFRSNFWIVRSLLFAASEFTRANYRSDLENNRDWLRLRAEIYKLLDPHPAADMSPYISSRALSLLPNLSLSQCAELERVDGFIERLLNERDSWQLLNLAFNLSDLPGVDHRAVEAWVFRTLNRMASHPNQHLLYAVEKTLDAIGDRKFQNPETPKVRAEIGAKLAGRRWRTNVEPQVHARGRADKVGIVYTPKYLEPDYENHVECRERLLAILNKLDGCGEETFVWITPREAFDTELKQVHNAGTDFHRDGSIWSDYIETVKQVGEKLRGAREQVERSGPSELRFESFEVAKMAAGGVIKGIDYVLDNEAPAAFVLNRPPGHLANNTICIFNNIAVGAHHALDRGKARILIVDCDAHHGKHTQNVFLRSSRVVYFSMHIDGDYAREDGMIKNIGEGEGEGYTFNIPYPAKMGDDDYRYIVDNLLLPVASDFRPELILVSAGFDGHFDDPLTPACLLSEDAYIHLARRLKEIAARNDCKIVGTLEGGYALRGMPNSLAHMLNVWGGWNLEAEIGYTPKPAGYDESLNPEAPDRVRQLVAERVAIMRETTRQNESYFFNPAAPHWQGKD